MNMHHFLTAAFFVFTSASIVPTIATLRTITLGDPCGLPDYDKKSTGGRLPLPGQDSCVIKVKKGGYRQCPRPGSLITGHPLPAL